MATLSPEFQVATILDEIGCAPSNFSEIAGRHANSRVIQGLKGQNDFSLEDGEYYLSLAKQMKKLAEEYPVPIAWKETQRIKEILAARRETTRPVPFAILMIGSALFKQIMPDGQVETATDYQTCAAFKNELVARAAAKILDGMGRTGLRTTTITNEVRPPETIFGELRDFGFVQ
jgi:hypothetical protein